MKNIFAIVLLGCILTMTGLISGCGASWYTRRDISRQHRYNYTYPNELAKDCAKWFPVKDSVGKIIVPANNIDYSDRIDSLQATIDSLGSVQPPVTKLDSSNFKRQILLLKNQISALKASYKPCKPDTIPHYLVNTAQLNVALEQYKTVSDSLVMVKTQLVQAQKSKKSWMLIAIGCMAVMLVFITIKTYTLISGGGIAALGNKLIKI